MKQLVVMIMEDVLSAMVLAGFLSDQDTNSFLAKINITPDTIIIAKRLV